MQRARHGPRRRWWSESWEADDAGAEGWGLDGPLAPGSSDAPIFVDQITTFFCSDGSVVQLGATPHLLQQLERRGAQRRSEGDTLPLPGEQGLCIGSVFRISATNGIEPSRRVNLAGFCFSTEQLYERVEDTVLARGGEVFETQRLLKRCGGLDGPSRAPCHLRLAPWNGPPALLRPHGSSCLPRHRQPCPLLPQRAPVALALSRRLAHSPPDRLPCLLFPHAQRRA